MPEGVNALEAWLGSIPGHAYANVRQPPVSTLNLAHMIPLSAVWAGPARDEHFQAPPLLYGKTEGSTPFRLSLHVGDVGHTLIVGPTGAGKSVLLALMAMQFRRYRNNQIFAFDFGGSIRTAAIAMGGDWHDLGGSLSAGSEHSVSLQPLARIDDQSERAWAAEWVAAILAKEGVTIDPTAKEHVWSALTSLASSPVQRAHHHRPRGAAAIDGAEAGAATLLRRRRLGPAARRRDRAARLRTCPGLRDRGPDRRRRGARRADLSLPSHRGPPRRPADACSSSTRAGWSSTIRPSPSSSASG